MVLFINPELSLNESREQVPVVMTLDSAKISVSMALLGESESNTFSKHTVNHSSVSCYVPMETVIIGESREKKNIGTKEHVKDRAKYLESMDFLSMNANSCLIKRAIQFHVRVLILALNLSSQFANAVAFCFEETDTHLKVTESFGDDPLVYFTPDGASHSLAQTSFNSKLDFIDNLNIKPENLSQSDYSLFQVASCSQSFFNLSSIVSLNFEAILVLDDGDAAKFLDLVLVKVFKVDIFEWICLMSLLVCITGTDRSLDAFFNKQSDPACSENKFVVSIMNAELENDFYVFGRNEVYTSNNSVSSL